MLSASEGTVPKAKKKPRSKRRRAVAKRGLTKSTTAPKALAPRPAAINPPVAGPCLDLVDATEIVTAALAPNEFIPQEKLGKTYLSPNERAAFRGRVHAGVLARGCQIGLDEIPNGAGTKHFQVRDAVAEHAQ
jgi:hypothetical protein